MENSAARQALSEIAEEMLAMMEGVKRDKQPVDAARLSAIEQRFESSCLAVRREFERLEQPIPPALSSEPNHQLVSRWRELERQIAEADDELGRMLGVMLNFRVHLSVLGIPHGAGT